MLSTAALLQSSVFMYMQLMVLARSYHLETGSKWGDVRMQVIGPVVNLYHTSCCIMCIVMISHV